MLQRLDIGILGSLVDVGHSSQKIVVSSEFLGRFAFGAFDLGLFELWRDRADNACGHLVLEIENVLQAAVETIRPQMRAGRRIDQLPGDAHLVSRFSNAAFKHVAYAKLATDLLDIDRLAFVGKTGIASSQVMRDSAVMMSSTMPSAKYFCSASPLMLVNGSTAIEGFSGRARAVGASAGRNELVASWLTGRARHARIGSEMFFSD
jgi:hypothetical protein